MVGNIQSTAGLMDENHGAGKGQKGLGIKCRDGHRRMREGASAWEAIGMMNERQTKGGEKRGKNDFKGGGADGGGSEAPGMRMR